jgi:hypothetical protein
MHKHQVRSNTIQRTTRSRTTPRFTSHRNSSTGRLETAPHGRWQISTAELATVYPEITCRSSSVIRSISMRMMEAAATNCGLMIPQTPQLGRWLISTAELATVTPEITCRSSSVIRSTSVQMMEAAATNCGLMTPQTPQLGGWLISQRNWPQLPRRIHVDARR